MEVDEEIKIEDVRQAQAIGRKILWMSVRSSPDLSYAIGALGREVTKHPRWARTVGWLCELEAEGLTLMMACPHGVK